MTDLLKRYAKAVGGVVVTVAVFVAAQLTDGITAQEWVLIVGTLFSSIGVGIVPNLDAGVAGYAKGFVSFFVAGTATMAVLINGGLTQAELIESIAAALAAVGVTVLRTNAPELNRVP
jgi:hypothetical protein